MNKLKNLFNTSISKLLIFINYIFSVIVNAWNKKLPNKNAKSHGIKKLKYHGMKLTKITEYHNDKKCNVLYKNIKNTNFVQCTIQN